MIGNLWACLIIFCCVITTLVMLPFHMIARWFRSPLRKKIEMRWHRTMCILLGVSYEVRGQMAQPDGHGVLIAANHVSWIDILVLGSIAPISFVAKEEVREFPIFGHFARWQESVFIDRAAKRTVQEQAERINARLLAGENIVLFPEGTTSDGNFIYPFKSSLFGALGVGDRALSSPIQPVSIVYVTEHGLPMGRFDRPLAAWPGDVEMGSHLMRVLRETRLGVVVSFGDPIAFEETTDRKQMSALAYTRVAEMTSSVLLGREPLLSAEKTP